LGWSPAFPVAVVEAFDDFAGEDLLAAFTNPPVFGAEVVLALDKPVRAGVFNTFPAPGVGAVVHRHVASIYAQV
jgi:hypothetical protein